MSSRVIFYKGKSCHIACQFTHGTVLPHYCLIGKKFLLNLYMQKKSILNLRIIVLIYLFMFIFFKSQLHMYLYKCKVILKTLHKL